MPQRPNKHRTRLFLGFLSCVLACACVGRTSVGPAEIDRAPDESAETDSTPDWSAEIDRAAARWRESGLDDYRIVVRDTSLWHMQTHDILVRDGLVVEASATCSPAPIEGRECEVRSFEGETYIVPGLFDRARWIAARGQAQHIRIEFDARYGYPTSIRYDDPEVIDEEWFWGVQEFEPIE